VVGRLADIETLAGSEPIAPGFALTNRFAAEKTCGEFSSFLQAPSVVFQHNLPPNTNTLVRQSAQNKCSFRPTMPCCACPVMPCLMYDRAAEREALERRQAEARILAMELRRKEMTAQVRTKVRGCDLW